MDAGAGAEGTGAGAAASGTVTVLSIVVQAIIDDSDFIRHFEKILQVYDNLYIAAADNPKAINLVNNSNNIGGKKIMKKEKQKQSRYALKYNKRLIACKEVGSKAFFQDNKGKTRPFPIVLITS